ncbi:VirB8/TrbF family protein [Nocardia crassostreae]|uniref:VirB8/TrbF family protein n=1 Tax=Nocardia crassostreae TaxID=53428 RepID=UPI00082EDF6F|nr:VirB8/TrbF family protein [Nocardia crassostreae]
MSTPGGESQSLQEPSRAPIPPLQPYSVPFPEPSRRPTGSARPSALTTTAAAVLAVAGIAGSLVYYSKYSGEQDTVADQQTTITQLRQQLSDAKKTETREATAMRAACDFITTLTTYDPGNLDAYVSAVLNGSTGTWNQDFANNSGPMREAMTFAQSRSNPLETNCALQSMEAQTAKVLVVVKQSTTVVDVPDPHVFTAPTLVTLQEQSDGRWLVSATQSL